MTVKIGILKSGEDVIADFKEVFSGDDEKNQRPIAYQMGLPYSIQVLPIDVEENRGRIRKISEPELFFSPWAPLSKESEIFIRMDEVISLYDAHDAVSEKYTKIIEAHQDGQRENPAPEKRGTD